METIPHNNLRFANQTIYWNGTDTYERWQQNMQNSFNRQRLIEYKWTTETAISYQYNSHGFRCKEFDQEPCYLAIGCSHTEGTGLPIEQTWPFLLAQATNKSILNLGVGGSGFDTCVRILDHYIDKLNIQGVFLLQPAHGRVELFNQFDFPNTFLANETIPSNQPIYAQWALQEKNIEYNVKKNTYSFKYLCNTKNIPCLIIDADTDSTRYILEGPDNARDLLHRGLVAQQRISDLFLELI
jgi:hypothetical protein